MIKYIYMVLIIEYITIYSINRDMKSKRRKSLWNEEKHFSFFLFFSFL